MNRDLLHVALDAYSETHRDGAKCSSDEVRDIAEERGSDLSWTTIACVMAALEAVEVSR